MHFVTIPEQQPGDSTRSVVVRPTQSRAGPTSASFHGTEKDISDSLGDENPVQGGDSPQLKFTGDVLCK